VAAVRCPKCGTINPDGRRRLARCNRCHEPLGKCRYCQHYDPRLLDCTSSARRTDDRIVDADAALNCPEFITLLDRGGYAGAIPWRALLRTGLIALAGSAFLMLALLRSLIPASPPPPVVLEADVGVPSTAFQEDGFEVTVFVLNHADHAAEQVQVLLSGSSMPYLVCRGMDPPEAFVDASPRSACALLGDLQPGDIRSVCFHFLAERPGEVRLVANVTATNLEAPTRVPVACQVLP
jgi:hypothetical protein